MSIILSVNGQSVAVEADPEMPLLWALREKLGLPGTKYGCGAGLCGACTVHVDGSPARACMLPIGALKGAAVTTIEGLHPTGEHPLQQAWIAHDVPQCGYCQSGMIMAAAALLTRLPKPSDTDIDQAMTNLCRCGTYPRIRAAIKQVAGT